MSWTEAPTPVGTHVTLRPTVARDRDAIIAAAADGRISELFFTNVSTLTDPDGFMATLFRERDFGRAMPFTVLTPDGRVVGLTRYMRMHAMHQRLEIGGTFYAKSVQRSGINTEAKLL